MRSVPLVFKFMASVSDASKFNVAAPWKTIDTSDMSLSLISCVMPSPSRPTSPHTTCSLDNSDLFVFLMESNNYRRNIEISLNIIQYNIRYYTPTTISPVLLWFPGIAEEQTCLFSILSTRKCFLFPDSCTTVSRRALFPWDPYFRWQIRIGHWKTQILHFSPSWTRPIQSNGWKCKNINIMLTTIIRNYRRNRLFIFIIVLIRASIAQVLTPHLHNNYWLNTLYCLLFPIYIMWNCIYLNDGKFERIK